MTLVMQTSDDFVGANGTMEVRALDEALGGTGAGYQWAHQSGSGWAINTNKAIAGAAGTVQILSVFNAPDATDGRVSMQSFKDDAGPFARLNTASGTKLYLNLRSSGIGYLFYYDGAAYNQIGVGTHTITDGAWMRIVPQGAFISCYIDSTLDIGPVNHPSIATGKPGMWAYEEVSSGHGATGFTYETGTLSVATPTNLQITTSLVGNQSGVNFTTQPAVRVADAGGSTVTTDTSTVTATLNTVSGSGTLGGTATAVASSGVATFSNLKVTGTGSFTITYTDGALTSVTTPTFYVGATQLAITSAPTTAFSKHATTIVVTAKDAGGTAVGNYTGTVAVTLNKLSGGSSVATMTGGTSSAAAVAGVATLTPIATTSDNGLVATSYTYTAAASGLTSATTATITPTVSESIAVTIT